MTKYRVTSWALAPSQHETNDLQIFWEDGELLSIGFRKIAKKKLVRLNSGEKRNGKKNKNLHKSTQTTLISSVFIESRQPTI